ncbi:hypothetical protein AWM79_15990 [Pseudomonas agarici]|uniref:PAAR domain-containing protein n=1 Tax=Pseudomonas agarici TaxID=46677 RepID=A0A0X1T443_PSEAA|nr:PAAR domain-containing protein [Pseudomonas agarici]AMB86722.1 hypothetical protein AWM79_15990 [Pseudomonas agarici]NWB93954.1 PAAR domain-containing protein [Pseudomonas agarici]NWC11422.1 PAAR domain-containing protein [Pseudomonas agarici]SEL70102.1 Zn-binding Pro-Ala-Ala-Arg (PAAR) domain-containing protein, incolved in TypeVI secretion [Pseudomonas agarici]
MTHPVCLGDSLNNGGNVIQCQLAATHRINGRPIAVVGDQACCELHQGTFAFVEGHPKRRMNNKKVVMEGHRLACGCHALAGSGKQIRVE